MALWYSKSDNNEIMNNKEKKRKGEERKGKREKFLMMSGALKEQ